MESGRKALLHFSEDGILQNSSLTFNDDGIRQINSLTLDEDRIRQINSSTSYEDEIRQNLSLKVKSGRNSPPLEHGKEPRFDHEARIGHRNEMSIRLAHRLQRRFSRNHSASMKMAANAVTVFGPFADDCYIGECAVLYVSRSSTTATAVHQRTRPCFKLGSATGMGI
eukprot:TRINITY_DN83755_c0_g1_i1.p1 TRINITY_DN83755_c0_g1~~TRINITY_DN83755_c0_g1_i1.p1  ORF type:complete len:168 (+),score=21.48 TRINITY_DN83755_c0_g1_i1:312-815(+)